MAITKRSSAHGAKVDEEWPRLHSAIEQAIAEWSRIEHALASAFSLTLGIDENIAERVFFSARTFNGKHDMLMAALRTDQLDKRHPDHTRQLIFISACKKAEKWASARNRLAHERPTVTTVGATVIGGVLTPNVLNKDVDTHYQQCMTTEAILECATNFEALAQIILEACAPDEDTSLEKLLERVRTLAPSPYLDSLKHRVTSALAHRPSKPRP